MKSFNLSFNESWLGEEPMMISSIGKGLYYNMLHNLEEFIASGMRPEILPNNYCRLMGSQVCFYWHVINDTINIISELGVRQQSLVVYQTAKNPEATDDVHATDLYDTIIKNSKMPLLFSDEYMTVAGMNIWKRLINMGYTVSIYNQQDPESGLIRMRNDTDLMNYCGSDPNNKKYRFVLADSDQYRELAVLFNTRKLRTLSGYPKD